jgi:hypothetical protein
MPAAGGHHRADLRDGPWQSFCRRKATLLHKLSAPGRVLELIFADARCVLAIKASRPDGSVLILRGRVALDEWRPLANDSDGEVFE